MIHIDGSQGEGGGQILRTSLALSMLTGIPVQFSNIRAGRKKPGLMRQHLTAVLAAAEISQATVTGVSIGARELIFKPGPVRAGDYTFSIGTAGSTTLVFQTVLPALMLADGPSRLSFEGGTHNPMAPPFDFLAEAFLPLLQRMGLQVSVRLERYGFYPAGGGRWTASIQPAAKLQPLILSERGELLEREAVAVWTHLPGHIAQRELKTIAERLNWPEACLHYRELPAPQLGPGNYLKLRLLSEHITEVFSAFGEVGVSAERLARRCATEVQQYQATAAPVGVHLADQLLLPLALAGSGEFITSKPSRHTQTNIAVIERFLPVRFALEKRSREVWRISVVAVA